ncbi:carbohydrate ABC transporter permease [Anaerocolumna sp. MB42-C2]|uniref:carbohydrate ABC transporter permease n=1 Tax=Anaerocolumna sp. MB42-C2 TaxID=3070997 RepID=UPI0027E0496E|nr:carbohydrate ABC transporter permease [Anaerocolumna sp. MB42-C2]WMJ90130.1 carbohydrate ABC transporter permease [Anaerocolumna sp. MB42-C2]
MKRKVKLSRRLFIMADYLLLLLIAVLCLVPMWHTVCASFSSPRDLASNRSLLLWPVGTVTLKGYQIVFANSSIWKSYFNTVIYVVGGTALGIAMTSVGAFVLSQKYFSPRNAIMLFVSFTMLFNGGMIPNYILIQKLGMLNSRLAIILPTAVNVFNLIILRTSFQGIPDSLEESAKLDGANDMDVFLKIILPLSKASIAVIVLFISVMHWNSWFPASLYLTERAKFPLQIILREILIDGNTNMTSGGANAAISIYKSLIKYCTVVISTLPILAIYPFIQKYFTKGVMIGAIKG